MNQPVNSDPFQPPVNDSASRAAQTAMEKVKLNRQLQNGAKNFYWVAGLSFLNSIITAVGGEFYLVVGLASTLFVDYVAVGVGQEFPDTTIIIKVIALVISLVASGIFALFGFLAAKGKRWAYILGMILYGIDTLIMLAFQEWKGLIIHLFFLWAFFTGLRALNQLRKLDSAEQMNIPRNLGY